MKKYMVYFELYGKKMKASVSASNEFEAKNKIQQKIIFHKVQLDTDDTVDFLKGMFNMK